MSAAQDITAEELEALADTHERTAAKLRELAAERRAGRRRGPSPVRTIGAVVTDLAKARAAKILARLERDE